MSLSRSGPLRILFLTQTFPRFAHDGAGPFIRDLARALVRGGDRVRVLAPSAPGVKARRDDDGVEVRTFRYAPRRFEIVGYGRTLQRDETVRGAALVAAPLYLAGAARAVRRELATGDWDLLHAHWIVPNGLVAAGFAGRLPVVFGVHGSDVFLAERRGVRRLVRHALRRVALLTSCSPELARRVEALGFAAEKSRVIPYGVDVDLFRPDATRRPLWRSRLGIPPDALVALGVGRMVSKKGFHLLVDALPTLLESIPSSHWVFAGAGDRLEELRQATAAWRDRVHFPGAVLHDDLPDLYRAADLFVLPAIHDASGNVDGLPNVVLEAMASGLPIVTSDISGLPLAVVDGVTGRLVPEGDRAALAAAVSALLDAPATLRQWGSAGRRRAEQELTWDAVGRRYRSAYEAAVAAAVS